MIVDAYPVRKYRQALSLSKAEAIMSSQKSDHELAPLMISNQLHLKLQILDKALQYGIYGDIELD